MVIDSLMITKTIKTKACCGATSIYFILDKPLSQQTVTDLVNAGFIEQPKFAQQGTLYVKNSDFSLSGTFGNTKVSLTCITKDCIDKTKILESLL